MVGDKEKISEEIMQHIREEPDRYRREVHFKDITPLLRDPESMRKAIDYFVDRYRDKGINVVVGLGARGFVIGSSIAMGLNAGFVPIETQGKGPYKTIKYKYKLKYADRIETLELHEDSINKGEKVLVFDSVIGSGKGAQAAAKLIEKAGGVIIGFAFLVELTKLKGRKRLKGYDVHSLVKY